MDNVILNNNNFIETGSTSAETYIILFDVVCEIYQETNITGVIYDKNGNILKCSSIEITIDGVNVTTSFNSDGTFYYTYVGNTSDVGTYTISATGYSDKFTNAVLTNATLEVTKITPSMNITAANTTYPNDIVIQITSNVDGNYTYTVGSISGNITVSNGTANITLSKLAVGEYNISVAFEGNENYSSNPATKAFKIIAPIQENANVNMFYLDGTSYKVLVYGADGNPLSGATVTFTVNKKTYTRTTDANGYATLSLSINTLVPGSYAITAAYNGYTVKNTVKVKQIIKAKKTTKVKKTAKKLKLKITLKGKSVLKKKTLKVKFKGKTYKAKTNKKGVAKVIIKKKVLKKLKAGKKYKYTIIYKKDKLKRTIKVKK